MPRFGYVGVGGNLPGMVDYNLIGNIGPSYIQGQQAGMEMLLQQARLQEYMDRRRREQEEEQWKKTLGQTLTDYYSTFPQRQTGPMMQTDPSWKGIPYRTPEPEGKPWLGAIGQTIAEQPKVDVGATLSRNVQQEQARNPARAAAELALKSGRVDDWLTLEKMARLAEDKTSKDARDLISAISDFRDERGHDALQAAWPLFQQAYGSLLAGVSADDLAWDDQAGQISLKTYKDDSGVPIATVVFGKNGKVKQILRANDPELRKLEREKLEAEIDYRKESTRTTRKRGDLYGRSKPGGGKDVQPLKITTADAQAIENEVAEGILGHLESQDRVPSRGAAGEKRNLFLSDKKKALRAYLKDHYEKYRRPGVDPPSVFYVRQHEWVSLRAMQLASEDRLPMNIAAQRAQQEFNQFYLNSMKQITTEETRKGKEAKASGKVYDVQKETNTRLWNQQFPEIKMRGYEVGGEGVQVGETQWLNGKLYIKVGPGEGDWETVGEE